MTKSVQTTAHRSNDAQKIFDEINLIIGRLRDIQGAIMCEGEKPRGCTWDKRNRCWKVRASIGGKTVQVGTYKTVEEAKAAYFTAKMKASA